MALQKFVSGIGMVDMSPEEEAVHVAQQAADSAPRLSLAEAQRQLVALLDSVTRPVLDAYPLAERLSWDAKEAEAKAAQWAGDPVQDDYPLLRGEIAAERGGAADDITSPDILDKAASVLAKAESWRSLVSAISGLRQRTAMRLDAAEDDAERVGIINEVTLVARALTG